LYRVKAVKDDIIKSKIGARVKKIFDEVSQITDVESLQSVTDMTRKLIKHWKDTFKSQPDEKPAQPAPKTKVHKTGVPIRDNLIVKFYEACCLAF
jgi:hypothetical protein